MLGRLFGGSEARFVSSTNLFGVNVNDWSGSQTWAGTPVSQSTAMQMEAVYSCIKLYADTISTLPAAPFVRVRGERKPTSRPAWIDDPGVDGRTWGDYVATGIVSYFIAGEWLSRVYRNSMGEPVALQVLNPADWEVSRDGSGNIVYRWGLDGNVVLGRDDILHMPDLLLPGGLRGVSRIDELKQDFGLAKALTEFAARFFGQGSISSGIIEMPQTLNAEQAMEVARAYEAQHKSVRKSHKVGVLGGGAKWVKTGVDPDEAQMLESRQASIESVARIFRVPPHKLGITTPGAMSYASVEQNNIAFAQDSLRPLIHKIEVAHSRLLPGGAFLRLNMDAVLRADTSTRYTAYSTALQSGWASINDVRRLEDLSSIDGGDTLRVPLANVDLSAANVVETEKSVDMAVKLITAGADPEATLSAFGLPAIPWTEAPEMPDPTEPADPADDMAEDTTEETT